ncbi:MAG: hypothetical protein JWQ30_2546 [Sediminibacterium sp.]|nr:hypothetical protein [Sediminibacterium sp.]
MFFDPTPTLPWKGREKSFNFMISDNHMPISFRLYLLVNKDAASSYPYAATSEGTNRLVFISEEDVLIIDPSDALFFETDYLPTSRSFEFDLENLDSLVKNYIGPLEYNIITRFNEEKHITLTYHSPNNEGPKDYDIFTGYPEKRAQKLVEEVYPLMETIKESVFTN